jgi:hypothetical protein
MLGSVYHHFDDALNIAIGRREGPNVHAKPTGNGRPHLIAIKKLTLDLTRRENFFRQTFKRRLIAKHEA